MSSSANNTTTNTNTNNTNTNTNTDDHFLRTIMGRLWIRPPTNPSNDHPDDDDENGRKADIFGEECRITREITRMIGTGRTDSLMPNSGQAVAFGDHSICVMCHDGKEENGSDYRAWEWHGHISTYDTVHGLRLEHIYGNHLERLTSHDEEYEDYEENLPDDDDENGRKAYIYREECRITREITRMIGTGRTDSLMPNSGQAVAFGDHSICVMCHDGKEENGSDYRAWEWHGHISTYDTVHGLRLEHIYGNHLERLTSYDEEYEDYEEENLGLWESIDAQRSSRARILHRNRNAGSPRFS